MAAGNGQAPIIIIKKRRGGGHAAHHGGAWKVAYADFVTAMMAFFLVMWLMGVDEETKAAIEHYFNHPNTPYKVGRDPASQDVHPLGDKSGVGDSLLSGAQGGLPDDLVQQPMQPVSEPEKNLRSNEELSDLLKRVTDNMSYGIEVNVDYLKFSLPEGLLFNPGTTQLKPTAEKYLSRLGPIFHDYRGYINIASHTDGSAAEGNVYEHTLSQAVNVMHYFVERKFGEEGKFFPSGEGDRRPLNDDSARPDEGNRRIEFTLSRVQKF